MIARRRLPPALPSFFPPAAGGSGGGFKQSHRADHRCGSATPIQPPPATPVHQQNDGTRQRAGSAQAAMAHDAFVTGVKILTLLGVVGAKHDFEFRSNFCFAS
jgi:hypothetical protein